MAKPSRKKIQFWDETMRDGEHTPGVYFSPEEKLTIATTLSEMGVDIMDVGIPGGSKEEARVELHGGLDRFPRHAMGDGGADSKAPRGRRCDYGLDSGGRFFRRSRHRMNASSALTNTTSPSRP